jgi:hypothetical protein
MEGWVKLHRKTMDNFLYKQERVFSPFEAWIDILMNVNYSDSKVLIKGIIYDVKKGESIKSLDTWGKSWRWSKSKVRRFLKTLEDDQMIQTINESVTTRLIVLNYEMYQGTDSVEPTPKKARKSKEINSELIQNVNPANVEADEKDFFTIAKKFHDLFTINSNQLGVRWGHLEKTKYKDCVYPIKGLFESDKRSRDELLKVYEFLKTDEFWKQNIQTTKKLREKFDQLITKANSTNGKSTFSQQTADQKRDNLFKKLAGSENDL